MVKFLNYIQARTNMANPLKNGDAKLKGLTELHQNDAIATASQLPNTTDNSVYFGWSFYFF